MKKILLIAFVLIPSISLGDIVDDYMARRESFFASFGWLAIHIPNGELPGDQYSHPFRNARLIDTSSCFGFWNDGSNSSAFENKTRIPSVLQTNISTVELAGSASAKQFLDASGELSVDWNDSISISFTHNSSTPRIVSLTRPTMLTAISEIYRDEIRRRNRERNYLLRDEFCNLSIVRDLHRLDQNLLSEISIPEEEVDTVARITIPWFIGEVLYAKERVTFTANVSVDTSAIVEIRRQIDYLNTGFETQFLNSNGGAVFVISDGLEYPVAWRPAFVSVDHINELRSASNRTLTRRLAEAFQYYDSPAEILESILDEYQEFIWDIDYLVERMGEGTMVQFDAENEDHIEYANTLGQVNAAIKMMDQVQNDSAQ